MQRYRCSGEFIATNACSRVHPVVLIGWLGWVRRCPWKSWRMKLVSVGQASHLQGTARVPQSRQLSTNATAIIVSIPFDFRPQGFSEAFCIEWEQSHANSKHF